MSDDLVDRDDISEGAIMDELKRRFMSDTIYSAIGPIIIALNPYKNMPALYGAENMLNYMLEGEKQLLQANYASTKAPHVWTIAQSAYSQLKLNMTRQAIVISGESGGTVQNYCYLA